MYPEQIAFWRDWAIVILSGLVVISALTFGLSVFSLMRKIAAIIYLITATVGNMRSTLSLASSLTSRPASRPKGRSRGLVSEMSWVVGFIMRLSRARKARKAAG